MFGSEFAIAPPQFTPTAAAPSPTPFRRGRRAFADDESFQRFTGIRAPSAAPAISAAGGGLFGIGMAAPVSTAPAMPAAPPAAVTSGGWGGFMDGAPDLSSAAPNSPAPAQPMEFGNYSGRFAPAAPVAPVAAAAPAPAMAPAQPTQKTAIRSPMGDYEAGWNDSLGA